MTRWVMRSVLPPTYAERSPMIPPRTEPMSVEATPTIERHAGAMDDARVDVAAEMVGAEPVLAARRRQALGGVGGDRIVGLELVGEDRGEQDHEHDGAARRAERLLPAEAGEHRPGAAAGRAAPAAPRLAPAPSGLAAIAHPRVEDAVEHVDERGSTG